MKRYISAILVPCLLLQIFGCYSSREISLDELPNFNEAIIITKDSAIYYLTNRLLSEKEMLNNPRAYFSNVWIVLPDSEKISLVRQKSCRESGQELTNYRIDKDKAEISYNDISSISTESISIGYTCLGLISIFGIILLIGYLSDPEHFGEFKYK